MRTWLLDTGPLVAYLEARDPAHREVVNRLDRFTGQLATTGAVLTEAMHFVSAHRSGPSLLAELAVSGDLQVFNFSEPLQLREASARMQTYADTPMDYADATLVMLSEELDTREVLTLDRRGFSTYRDRDGRAFAMVLDLG